MGLEQIITLAIGALVTATIGAGVTYIKEMHHSHVKAQEEKDKTIEGLVAFTKEVTKRLDVQEQQMEVLKAEIKELNAQIKLITYGGMALLRDRIVQACRTFLERGSITLDARNNISEMYKWYAELGGNSTGEYYYKKMMELPVDDTPSVLGVDSGYLRHEHTGR